MIWRDEGEYDLSQNVVISLIPFIAPIFDVEHHVSEVLPNSINSLPIFPRGGAQMLSNEGDEACEVPFCDGRVVVFKVKEILLQNVGEEGEVGGGVLGGGGGMRHAYIRYFEGSLEAFQDSFWV